MVWNVGMSGEKEGTPLLREGEHIAMIEEVKLVSSEESKSGNPYFFWKLETTEGSIDIRTTLLKGKRWLLKQLLSACGIKADEKDPDQKYTFEEADVLGKEIIIVVVNRKNTFTGREGNEITVDKSEVNKIKAYQEERGLRGGPIEKKPEPKQITKPKEKEEKDCDFRIAGTNRCDKRGTPCPYFGIAQTEGPKVFESCNDYLPAGKLPF